MFDGKLKGSHSLFSYILICIAGGGAEAILLNVSLFHVIKRCQVYM